MKRLLTRTQLEAVKLTQQKGYDSNKNQHDKLLVLEDGTIIATDAYVLVRVGPIANDNFAWTERCAEINKANSSQKKQQNLIHREVAEKLLQNLPRATKSYWYAPKRESVIVDIASKKTEMEIGASAGLRKARQTRYSIENIEGDITKTDIYYEDHRDPIPENFKRAKMSDASEFILARRVNARHLRALCDLIIKANKEKPLVDLYIHKDRDAPLEFWAESQLQEQIMGLVAIKSRETDEHPVAPHRGTFLTAEELPYSSLQGSNKKQKNAGKLSGSVSRKFK